MLLFFGMFGNVAVDDTAGRMMSTEINHQTNQSQTLMIWRAATILFKGVTLAEVVTFYV